jgi:hypothetical protein
MPISMNEIGWKKRLAIVLSFLWVTFALLVSVNEQQNSLVTFVALGILPLSIPWGIAWVWVAFHNRQPLSASKLQDNNESSHIISEVDTAIVENDSHSQSIPRQHENKWLARAFTVTSLVGFVLYAGLLIRAVVIGGNFYYALGALFVPAAIAFPAISKNRAPTNTIILLVAIAISSLISIGGFQSWNEIIAANKLAEVAQQHLNDVKLLTQESNTLMVPSTSTSPTEELSPRSLSESEILEFLTKLMQESSDRQIQKGNERLAEYNQLGLEAIWEPANLLSATGIKDGQRRIAAYQELLSKMEADYDAEINWQDEKVLSVAGQDGLKEFRQGRASNQNDTKNIYRLQRASTATYNELLSFFYEQVKQNTVSFQDGQFTFTNQIDAERFNQLAQQAADQEKNIADLQTKGIISREKGIEEMKMEAGQQ